MTYTIYKPIFATFISYGKILRFPTVQQFHSNHLPTSGRREHSQRKSKMARPPNSKIANRYVSFVDEPFKNSISWLECKRRDDGAEGLWRIHDDLYDLSTFVDKHPGGSSWLILTKGTDITEAFETHHMDIEKSNQIAQKYYVRRAAAERNVKFTFAKDGFYQTLKRRVVQKLKESPKTLRSKTNIISDGILFALFSLSILATVYPWLILLAGVALSFLVITGHNYFHRSDNFRMYYFNISFMNFRDWRITHGLSHHLFTNSLMDIELLWLAPFFCWLPNKEAKGFVVRYVSWVYGPLVYSLFFVMEIIKKAAIRYIYQESRLDVTDAIPLSLPIAMYMLGSATIGQTLLIWTGIICFGSFVFAATGLNAGHHHPDVFHDGDEVRENLDWGAYQLDTIIDRDDVRGNHFLVVTNFGDHILHHIFPTLDHGYLKDLYPILYETVKEFSLEARKEPWSSLIVGQHQQLARIEPSDRLAKKIE